MEMGPALESKEQSDAESIDAEFVPEPPKNTTEPERFYRNGQKAKSTDRFIAVMGVTGSGKSTFISHLSDKKPRIEDGIESCKPCSVDFSRQISNYIGTLKVDVFPLLLEDLSTVYLIDTPGFDDSDRSDTDVLRELASWLTESYSNGVKLDGIIYLHRISDIKMQGSAKRNLVMFQKLCGAHTMERVVLATTMWCLVPPEIGKKRELQLKGTKDHWGWMISRGSQVVRHENSAESALSIVRMLLINRPPPVTLEIQDEMVMRSKTLEQTQVGREVEGRFIKLQRVLEVTMAETLDQITKAIEEQDSETITDLNDALKESNTKIKQLNEDREKLKTTVLDLGKENHEGELAKLRRISELADMKEKEWAQQRKELELQLHFAISQKNSEEQTRAEADADAQAETKLEKSAEAGLDGLIQITDLGKSLCEDGVEINRGDTGTAAETEAVQRLELGAPVSGTTSLPGKKKADKLSLTMVGNRYFFAGPQHDYA
jgi:GTPase SAR1 family protein